jgi:peptide/nickel transport system permease protein
MNGALPRLLHEPRVAIGMAILMLLVVVAALAPLLAPHDPNQQDLLHMLLPPFWEAGGDRQFLLGTDGLGRCVLSRLIYGARVAVTVGTIVPIGTVLLGTTLAIIAGYCGRWVDWLVSRIVDIWMSFPPVVLSLVLMVGLSPGLRNVILATVLVDWTRFCRVTRSAILGVMRLDYIASARIAGATHMQVMSRELLPAVFPTIITLVSIEIGIAVVVESVLSFVGVSVSPDVPTWGSMIADGLANVFQEPWGLAFPMMAIVAIVLGANMLGDGLRMVLDNRVSTTRLEVEA